MTIHAGILRIRFRLPAETLKEKRTVVKSVTERLRNRFNTAVAEVEDVNTPSIATIAATVVSNDRGHADSQLQAISRALEEWRLDVEIVELETEIVTL